ncbi:MAG: hypothetical protein HS107_01715 [Thermoflexaceae bacterium]|nr:hypothetical protein [Thermoflexaceae bacterium]
MPHRNAKLTPAGRLLIVQRLEQAGPRPGRQGPGVSRSTVAKWMHRYREQGEGLQEASSALRQSPAALSAEVVEAILSLRRTRGGPTPHRPRARPRRLHGLRRPQAPWGPPSFASSTAPPAASSATSGRTQASWCTWT